MSCAVRLAETSGKVAVVGNDCCGFRFNSFRPVGKHLTSEVGPVGDPATI